MTGWLDVRRPPWGWWVGRWQGQSTSGDQTGNRRLWEGEAERKELQGQGLQSSQVNSLGDEKLWTNLDGLAFPSCIRRDTQVQERAWERLAPASKLDARIFNNTWGPRSYKSSRDCLDWLGVCPREHLESLERSPQMNKSKTVAGLPGSWGACKSFGGSYKAGLAGKKKKGKPGCNNRELTTRTKPKRWKNPPEW